MSQKFVKTTGNFSKQMDASEKCARSYVMVLSNWDWETRCQVFLFSPSHGNDMGNFLGDPGTRKTIFMIRWPGRSQDFSNGGGGGGRTVSNREYSPDFHVHLYAVFYVMWQKKKAYHRAIIGGPGPPPPSPLPLATPLKTRPFQFIVFFCCTHSIRGLGECNLIDVKQLIPLFQGLW